MSEKITFCKIVELENHQVLFIKNFDDADDKSPYKLEVSTRMEYVHPKVTMSFSTEDRLDAAFDKSSEEYAKKFISDIETIMK